MLPKTVKIDQKVVRIRMTYRFILVFCFIWTGIVPVMAQSENQLVKSSNSFFEKKQYSLAIDGYRQLLSNNLKNIDFTFLTSCPSLLKNKINNSFFIPNPSDTSFEILKNYEIVFTKTCILSLYLYIFKRLYV